MVTSHHVPQQEYRMDRTPDDNNMHHDDVDDELSRTSADWGLTNRSVALTNAVADPWNHPLLMDCDDDDDTDDAYHTCLHDTGHHAIPTCVPVVVKQARVSMDVTESWMTDAHDAHHHHHEDGPLWMEGLELDPILTEVSTTIATSLSASLWNRPSRNDMELNPALGYDDDDDALNLMIMDEMECVLKNEVGTQATECSGSVSSDGAVEGSILTVPSPPPSFGIVPFNTVIPTSLCQETTSMKESSATSTALATNEVSVVIVSSAQFHERREMLAASMRASQISRQCLHMKENVQRRQVLQKVLEEIAQSTATVQHHCLQIPPTDIAENESLTVNDARHSSLPPTTPATNTTLKEPGSNVKETPTRTASAPLLSAATVESLDNPEINSTAVPMATSQLPKAPEASENDEKSAKCQTLDAECRVVLDQAFE
jgi:hypothetical protein